MAEKKPEPEPKVEVVAEIKPTPVATKSVEVQTEKTSNAADIKNYGAPVSSIRKALGINDIFLFVRELYNGNSKEFNDEIDALDQLSNYEQAHQFIINKHADWDQTDATVDALLRAIHRRFL